MNETPTTFIILYALFKNRTACSLTLQLFSLRLILFIGQTATFAALFPDFGVEFGALLSFGGLATFFPDFGVKLGAALLFDRLATLFPDFGVEFRTVFLPYSLATVFCLLRPAFRTTLVVCH